MTTTKRKFEHSPSRAERWFEIGLLILTLCTVVVRVLQLEGIQGRGADQPVNLTTAAQSAWLSGTIIFIFLIWTVMQCSRGSCYRISYLEIGIAIFTVACIAGFVVAPNKRDSISMSATMLSMMLTGFLIFQLAKSPNRLIAVLYVIVAIGICSSLYAAAQKYQINEEMITQYQAQPQQMLNELGVQPGSFQQMLFEHSLYSRDVRGFFMTGNSAGAFGLLSGACAACLFFGRLANLKHRRHIIELVFLAISTLICMGAILITFKKGAIAAVALAFILFAIYAIFKKPLQRFRYVIFILTLLSLAGLTTMVVHYGVTHDRLPGGNSMLVRWQYWQGAAEMIADHPFLGVGPGNFTYRYTHYKAPGALESVADPHNAVLSLLAQYGPLGLVGFFAAIGIPLWVIMMKKHVFELHILATLQIAVVVCAILAFIAHSLIDFAIFEPGVGSIMWIMVAIAALLGSPCVEIPLIRSKAKWIRRVIVIVCIGLFAAYLYIGLIPVLKSTRYIVDAHDNMAQGAFMPAHAALQQSAKADRLNPLPLSMDAKLYLQQYYQQFDSHPALEKAEHSLLGAIERNPADYRHYENLAQVYLLVAHRESSDSHAWFEKAFLYTQKAIRRYPNIARLHMMLAQIAEELDKKNIALDHYQKAVWIEDQYREQFHVMYPDRPLFSRLGQESYLLAKKRIETLSSP